MMKDVMILGIQQYRILALFSSDISCCIRIDSRTIQKCDASVRKLDFLCRRGADTPFDFTGVRCGELFPGTAFGCGQTA